MRRLAPMVLSGMVAASALAMSSGGALACACCSEPGQRIDIVTAIDEYLRAELGRIDIRPTARLYTDEGFPETIEGVEQPSDADYAVDLSRSEQALVLSLTDVEGNSGSIELPIPGEIARFEVDPRDGASEEGGTGPTLYKEWRLEGEARLAGIFAAASRRANAVLVLQGRGKGCTSAADFAHWTLAVSGTGVRFMLLGGLEAVE